MADKSKIEWTDATWPIVQGCDYVSPGCANCYAVPLINRLAHNPNGKISLPLAGLVDKRDGKLRWTGKVALRHDRLNDPLSWKNPRMIFVPSHGDLFHEDVPDEFIDKVFATMASAAQHTFQVLTKRAERMTAYLKRVSAKAAEHANLYQSALIDYYSRHGVDLTQPWQVPKKPTGELRFLFDSANSIDPNSRIEDRKHDPKLHECHWREWPLSNVWLGVSVEDQQRFAERVGLLRQTPAALRFLSLEPLLEDLGTIDLRGIDWVIVGGESGNSARPCDVRWIRSIVRQCQCAGVPAFVKQLGGHVASRNDEVSDWLDRCPSIAVAHVETDGSVHQGDPVRVHLQDRKGGEMAEWPEDLRVREWPR